MIRAILTFLLYLTDCVDRLFWCRLDWHMAIGHRTITFDSKRHRCCVICGQLLESRDVAYGKECPF